MVTAWLTSWAGNLRFYDLPGGQGRLGQADGRTADDVAYWVVGASPAWRDAVQVVVIDMCTVHLPAIRRMLLGAAVAADMFHVVQLAVKTLGDVRRRAIRGKFGRRGRCPGSPLARPPLTLVRAEKSPCGPPLTCGGPAASYAVFPQPVRPGS